MNKFVEPLNLDFDLCDELIALIDKVEFYESLDRDEIYLKNRVSPDEDIWWEIEPKFNVPVGELKNKIKSRDDLIKAMNYTDRAYLYWNNSTPIKIIQSVEAIESDLNINIHRVTLNRLRVTSGLSIHSDGCKKIHYPVVTSDHAFFYDASDLENQVIYNLKKNKFYNVDTERKHYVYNADTQDRVHLIMCYDGEIK